MDGCVESVYKTYIGECEDKFRTTYAGLKGKQVYIYGSGMYGTFLRKALVEYGCVESICAYINDYQYGVEKDGIPVINLNEVDYSSDYCIVVGIQNSASVVAKLKSQSVNFIEASVKEFWNSVNLMYSAYYADDPNYEIENIKKRFRRFHLLKMDENVMRSFYKDDVSKKVVDSRINFYKTGKTEYLENCPISPIEYFHADYMTFGSEEIFVDVGAFDGDSITNFAKYVGGSYKTIYGFEPDPANYTKLKENTSCLKNVFLYPYAVGEEKGTIGFSSGQGMQSMVSASGEDVVRVERLDDIIKEPISILKMDIEGFELSALRGAEKLIKKYHPKLAICIYHKVEDLLEIPLYLKSIVPEYRFKLRRHTGSVLETCLFAEV